MLSPTPGKTSKRCPWETRHKSTDTTMLKTNCDAVASYRRRRLSTEIRSDVTLTSCIRNQNVDASDQFFVDWFQDSFFSSIAQHFRSLAFVAFLTWSQVVLCCRGGTSPFYFEPQTCESLSKLFPYKKWKLQARAYFEHFSKIRLVKPQASSLGLFHCPSKVRPGPSSSPWQHFKEFFLGISSQVHFARATLIMQVEENVRIVFWGNGP